MPSSLRVSYIESVSDLVWLAGHVAVELKVLVGALCHHQHLFHRNTEIAR